VWPGSPRIGAELDDSRGLADEPRGKRARAGESEPARGGAEVLGNVLDFVGVGGVARVGSAVTYRLIATGRFADRP
jgi:hypothetical protein